MSERAMWEGEVRSWDEHVDWLLKLIKMTCHPV